MAVEVTLFTDPACPFAFSGEPARIRLRWHYGDALAKAAKPTPAGADLYWSI